MEYCDTVAKNIINVLSNYENAYEVIIELVNRSCDKYELTEMFKVYYESIIVAVADSIDATHGSNNVGSPLVREICLCMPNKVYEMVADHFYELTK